MCSCDAFVKFAKVRYFNSHWLRCCLFPYVPLVSGSLEAAVGIWGSSGEEVEGISLDLVGNIYVVWSLPY